MRSSRPYVFTLIALILGVGHYALKERPPALEPAAPKSPITEAPVETQPKKLFKKIVKPAPTPKPEVAAPATAPAAAVSAPPNDDELRAIAYLGGEEPVQEPVPDWELNSELLEDLVQALETDETGALLEFRDRFHLKNVQLIDIRRHLQIKKRRTQESDGNPETLEQIREDFRAGILDVLGQQ